MDQKWAWGSSRGGTINFSDTELPAQSDGGCSYDSHIATLDDRSGSSIDKITLHHEN